MVLNWPYTLLAIMPTNNKLMSLDPSDGTGIRKLIETWGYLHALRSVLGVVATLIFLKASM
jgi:Domain of unknown function (DUF1772)